MLAQSIHPGLEYKLKGPITGNILCLFGAHLNPIWRLFYTDGLGKVSCLFSTEIQMFWETLLSTYMSKPTFFSCKNVCDRGTLKYESCVFRGREWTLEKNLLQKKILSELQCSI